jgi:hypothetical protein
MGNCHCRPRQDGESLREYLARKFRISGKGKIDDRVTIANQDEKGIFLINLYSAHVLHVTYT